MPGNRVAMVTGPRLTPRGHFDLTEWMSPVCVCVCVCTWLLTRMAICQKKVCVFCLHEFVTLQSPQFLKKFFSVRTLFSDYREESQDNCFGKNAPFRPKMSNINSPFH